MTESLGRPDRPLRSHVSVAAKGVPSSRTAPGISTSAGRSPSPRVYVGIVYWSIKVSPGMIEIMTRTGLSSAV